MSRVLSAFLVVNMPFSGISVSILAYNFGNNNKAYIVSFFYYLKHIIYLYKKPCYPVKIWHKVISWSKARKFVLVRYKNYCYYWLKTEIIEKLNKNVGLNKEKLNNSKNLLFFKRHYKMNI